VGVDDRTLYLAAYKCLETIKHLFTDADAIKCYDAIWAYSQNKINKGELSTHVQVLRDVYFMHFQNRWNKITVINENLLGAVYHVARLNDCFILDIARAYALTQDDDDDDYDVAKANSIRITADICRKYLTTAILEKAKI
jgi:hypothetical protein